MARAHRAHPTFRPDLSVLPRRRNGQVTGYVVNDPRSGVVFEIEEPEYFLCQQLDGKTPLDEVLRRFRAQRAEALSGKELEAFVGDLDSMGLLVRERAMAPPPAPIAPEKPLYRKRLFDPGPLVRWLAPRLTGCFSRWGFRASMGFILLGVWILVQYWGEFWDGVMLALWGRLLLFLVMWLGVQLLVALALGVAASAQGAPVAEIGIQQHSLLPVIYCEIGDGPWRRDKARRVAVRLTPVLFGLLLMASGMLLWRLNGPGSMLHGVGLFVAAASLFWAWLSVNPLRPRDGVYLLSVLTDEPNLRDRTTAAAWAWLTRRQLPEPLTRRQRTWFVAFGLLTLLFIYVRGTFEVWVVGRLLMDSLQGVGILIFLFLVVWLMPFGRPVRRMLSVAWNASGRIRMQMVTRLAIVAVILVLLFLPYPYDTGGPFRILSGQRGEVHVEIDGGLIQAVSVTEGQQVRKGDVIGQIDTREYQRALETSQAQLAVSAAQLRLARKQVALLTQTPDIERVQQLEAEVQRLETIVRNARQELELTVLRAPIEGRVTTPHVEKRVGEFLKKGELFAVVEDSRTVEVEVAVPEWEISEVELGVSVRAVPWAFPDRVFPGKVSSVGAVATGERFDSRVVNVLARIDNPDGVLKPEMTGKAKIRGGPKRVWEVLVRRIWRWIQVEVWYWLP